MFRSIQASFRQLRGINVQNRLHRIWMKYFTIQTQPIISSITKNHPLNGHYTCFNLADVNQKVLYTQADMVETDPGTALPTLLNLEQPISPHYFKFCKLFLNEYKDIKDSRTIVFEAHPHLMRAFLCFAYQTKEKIEALNQKRDTAFLPSSFVYDFSSLIRVITFLPNEFFSDFLFAWGQYQQYILALLPKIVSAPVDSPFTTAISEIFHVFIDLLFSDPGVCPEMSEVTLFIMSYFTAAFNANQESEIILKTFSTFCEKFSSNATLRNTFNTQTLQQSVMLIVSILLSLTQKDPKDDLKAYFQSVPSYFKLIHALTPIKSELLPPTIGQYGIMTPIVDFIEWCSRIELKDDIIPQPCVLDPVYKSMQYPSNPFTFRDEKLISPLIEIPKVNSSVMSEIHPLYLEKSPILISILLKVALICGKSQETLSDFVRCISTKLKNLKSLKMQYLAAVVLFSCSDANVFHLVMDSSDSWSTFISKAIFNKNTVLNQESENIMQLKEMVFSMTTRAFLSKYDDKKKLIQAMSNVITPDDPHIFNEMMFHLNKMIQIHPPSFIQSMIQTDLLNKIFETYFQYRELAAMYPEDKITRDVRMQIVQFIFQIIEEDSVRETIYKNDSYCEALYMLLFEEETQKQGFKLILQCLSTFHSTSLLKHLNTVMRVGLQQPMNPRWKDLLYRFFDLITDAAHYNCEVIASFFPSSGCLSTFGLIPAVYTECDSKDDVYKFLVKDLDLFILMFNKSNTFQTSFSNPNANVRANMEKALKHIKIDEVIVNHLLSLATNTHITLKTITKYAEITCVDGLAMLYNATEGTEFHQPIIDFLAEITEHSISNRYQCFRANIIQNFMKLIPTNTLPSTMKLFSQIGASYFRMNELSLTIRLLKSVNSSYVLPLVASINKMMELYDTDTPTSFLHFGIEDPVFSIPPFQINKKFALTSMVYLENDSTKLTKRPSLLINITSKTQKLDVSIVENEMYIDLTDDNKTKNIKLTDQIQYHTWFKLCISFEPRSITVYFDKKQMSRIDLDERFVFSDNIVYFSIRGEKANIEKVCLFNWSLPAALATAEEIDEKAATKYYALSKYSAAQFHDNKCINGVTDGIVSASFNGLVVPFMISTIEAIPTCGGPRIFLPLFEMIDQSENPPKLFRQLLTVIHNLAAKNETLFENQRFFRSLGHILLKIKKEIITEHAIDELYGAYKCIKIDSLKKEMIRYVWGDFAIWMDVSVDLKLFVFTGVFTGLLQTDAQTLIDVIPFKDFMTRFIMMLQNEKEHELINRCWNFLFILAQEEFTMDDAVYLYTAIISTTNTWITLSSIELLRNLITENSRAMIEFIREREFYHPFIQLLNHSNELVRVYGIHLLYYVHYKARVFGIADIDLSDILINAVRLYYHTDQTDYSIHITLGCMFGVLDIATEPPINYIFDVNKAKSLEHPQFFPLIETMIQDAKPEMIQLISDVMLKTLLNDDKSCINMGTCNLYPFWIIFFSFRDGKLDEWIKVLARIMTFKATQKDFDPMYELMTVYLICQNCGLKSTSIIREMLMGAVTTNNQKVLDFSLRFILYVDVNDDDLKMFRREPLKPQIKFDLLQTFAQKIILSKENYDNDLVYTRQTTTDPWPDFFLAIRVVRAILDLDPRIFNSNITFFPEITITYATLAALLMTYIYQQSRSDSDPLVAAFCAKSMKCQNRELLVTSMFILLDKYSYTCDESEKLIDTLRNCSKSYEIVTLETVNDITEGAVTTTINDIMRTMDNYRKARLQFIVDRNNILSNMLDNFYNDNSGEHFFYDIKQLYRVNIENIFQENARILRGNAKFWRDVMKMMHNQIGGPWGAEESIRQHFMAGNYLDPIGRRMKTKVNYHFTLHEDASLRRDNSLDEQNVQSIFVPSTEPTDTDEPNNRLNTVQIECRFITLAVNYTGTLFLGNNLLAFESSSAVSGIGNEEITKQKIIEIGLDQISFILKRRYLHIDNSVEVFTTSNRSYFFIFANDPVRMSFLKQIKAMKPPNCRFIQLKDAIKFYHEMSLAKKWNNGEISNYEYLYWLNILAGRSFHDLAQYPVFPWVIADYTSQTLDLTKESSYRDLSKPMGALNEERLEQLDFLYKETKDTPMAALYRFHYSTAAYVIGYLIRVEPFTSLHIDLQSGKFDHPNRLFYSIPESYGSCVSKNPDFRELIPEFFTFPDMINNTDRFDLGNLLDGGRVDDVILPPWAKSASDFITINRLALESPYVSAHIHQWIDLIFGFNSRGINAEKAHNNFHPYSYPSAITPEVLSDPAMLTFVQSHAANCGVVPDQLFQQPHSQRMFIPRPSKLSDPNKPTLFEPKKYFRAPPSVLRFTPQKDTVWILTKFGDITQHNAVEGTLLQEMKVSLTVPSDIARLVFFEKHLVFRPQAMFLSTPLSKTVYYIDITEKRTKDIIAFKAHSVAITSIAMDIARGEMIAATSAGDSSLIVWDLKRLCGKCRIVAHTSSIVSVDVNILSDVVASIDESGTLVLSSLTTGSFLRSANFGPNPSYIKISPLGYIVVIYQIHEERGDSTRIIVVDFGTRTVAEKVMEGKLTAFSMIELKDSSSFLAVALETKYVYIMNIFDLNIRCKGPVADTVTEIEYSKDEERLFILQRNGDIYKFDFIDA